MKYYHNICSIFSPGVGRWCWPQLNQREDLHPGNGTSPGHERASRPQRQGDSALLCGGSIRPQWSRQNRRKDRHLEGGVKQSGNGLIFYLELEIVKENFINIFSISITHPVLPRIFEEKLNILHMFSLLSKNVQ